MSTRYNIKAADEAAVATLQQMLGVSRFMARTLVVRGIDDVAQAKAFLSPSLDRDWINPYEVAGMQQVVDGLESAVRCHEHIMVFGDFDLDGISATTVLTRGLRALGADVTPFIPRRNDEGYGLTEAAIERCLECSPDVLVTVDCGISCRDEVRTLQHRGVKVFITDHHEPSDLVPVDVPVCDPKLVADSPCSILAGVGVALKLVQALGARFGQPHLWREYTDLATLGTVADLMPMRAVNRALVADGVAAMNEHPRPCIAALLATAGAIGKPVTATSLSFSVIPRLNAAGRMDNVEPALDLLLTDDFDEAARKAEQLEQINDQRRAIESELAEIASLQAQEVFDGQRVLVVAGDGWHEGVKGIVANRLVRSYGVPTLLFTIDEDGEARGSGRSVGNVNLFKAVESCSDLLTRYGGHEAAVGVTLPAEDLDEFTKRMCAYMETLPQDCFTPRVDIDATVDLAELTLDNVAELERLAPFGQENRQPCFLAQDVLLTKCRAVGADKNHFSCVLTDGISNVAGIMFHCSDIDMLMHCNTVVNAAFELQIDEWRGRKSVKAMLDSLVPVRPCKGLQACIDPETQSFVADLYASAGPCTDDECRIDKAVDSEEDERACTRHQWEERASRDPEGLRGAIVEAFIGQAPLLDAQVQVLDALEANESVLGVMATGRGKSLTFQVHAVMRALMHHQASLLVYPLRALIADQAFHLRNAVSQFGVTAEVLTGESTPEERAAIFAGLADGSVDIVLTTPEFLSIHVGEFRATRRIGFLVVDEAHHIGLAKAGNRPAYARISEAVSALGAQAVLALTATASCDIARSIEESLGTKRRVLDGAQRTNLLIDDQRGMRSRDHYLANMIASGEKTVIYVNSRQQTVALARELRKSVPQMASLIGFYNAGLARSDRMRIEDMFRRGSLAVLVSTSAFGEGVNIPDIRHVVLYHMPFNGVEFNQMSGRAGRDGQQAVIHALFGAEDARINESILYDSTPGHDTLAQVYRQLRAMQKASGGTCPFSATNTEIAAACSQQVPQHEMKPASVECGVAVFRELGLIETKPAEADDRRRTIRMADTESKVELTDSVRYREGLDEQAIFATFRDWALKSPADVLQAKFRSAILPEDGGGGDGPYGN